MIEYRYAPDPSSRGSENATLVLDLDKEMIQHPAYDATDPDRLYLERGREAYKWADARVESMVRPRYGTGRWPAACVQALAPRLTRGSLSSCAVPRWAF